MGAPVGNKNAAKDRWLANAYKRALATEAGTVEQGLDKIALRVVRDAFNGDQWSIREIGDRLDGKPAQAIIGGGDDDPPLKLKGVVELVRPG
jgi:hypothetical protein